MKQSRSEEEKCREERDNLMDILRGLYEDNIDYITKNNIPGAFNNHYLKLAREVLGIEPKEKDV